MKNSSNKKMDLIRYSELALEIRKDVLNMTLNAGSTGAHIGGALSMAELLAVLYGEAVNYDKDCPLWEERDRVILSKGHAAIALYAALAETGILDKSDLSTFKCDGSKLGGHPSLNGLPGIEFSSGSLGQGLSQGVGVAIALKKKGNTRSKVFVLLGDGECNEGAIWEAAASASHYALDNLIVIIDCNALQYDGNTEEILNMEPFAEKWKSFGWEAIQIDGHNIEEICKAYDTESPLPKAIIAKTVKGKGISFMENNCKFHNASLSQEQYEIAMGELTGRTLNDRN